MSGTSNFMTDTMNAQGLMGLMGPNPYLEYTGQIPMAGYRGAPTDAMGNPIASFTQAQQQHDAWNAANPAPAAQGTTLNSTPQGAPTSPIRTALPVMSQTGGGPGNTMAPNWQPSNYVATGQNYTIMPKQGGAPQRRARRRAAEPHRHAPGLSRRALQPWQGDDARRADAAGNQPDRTLVPALGAGAVSTTASWRRDDGRRRV